MTNVKVRGAVSKVGDSSVQNQIDELFESLKIVVDEMLKMK